MLYIHKVDRSVSHVGDTTESRLLSACIQRATELTTTQINAELLGIKVI